MNLHQKTQPNVWVKDDVMSTPLQKRVTTPKVGIFQQNQNVSTLGKHVYFNRKTQELFFFKVAMFLRWDPPILGQSDVS